MRRRALLSAALWACACSSPRSARRAPEAAPDATAAKTASREADLRALRAAPGAALLPVPFAFDSATLSPEARQALEANARALRAAPDAGAVVEGHCDDSGTADYNLALGQRRAMAVREYYLRLGLEPERLATVSLGEERPACSGADDACRARNRRAETVVGKQPKVSAGR